MTADPQNLFGFNLPLDDPDEVCRLLGIGPTDRVLEVGGAGNPFPRADTVCDLTFGSCAQRNGAPAVFRDGVNYVEAPVEGLPFRDGEFDFVYCTQVLEHVRDPEAAARELARVARRGFVEVPSRLGELCSGNPSHRWIIDREADELVFSPRLFVEHPLLNFFYGVIFKRPEIRELAESTYRNVFNHQVVFEGKLPCRVLASADPSFNYDDPHEAGRAHLSFAQNALAAGADPAFAYPDAVLALRLLPAAREARLLLALYQGRLLRPEDGLRTLEGVDGTRAEALRRVLTDLAAGKPVDLECAIPHLPPIEIEGAAPGLRPLVTIIVSGGPDEELLAAAETALQQDYPAVEVIVAPTEKRSSRWSRWEMGERLRIVETPAGSVAAAVNAAAALARGRYVGFLLAKERYLAHHVERLVDHLERTSAAAVHGDRLLVTGEGVVGPKIVPGSLAARGGSLSTVIARKSFLDEIGGLEDAPGDAPAFAYLLRLAGTGRLVHVREVTVKARGPLPEGAEVLDLARAAAGISPLELMRDLIASHAREEGLRARIRLLEAHARQHAPTEQSL